MLEIKNLTKIYGGKKIAVDNLSFKVNKGEIFGFIGHNGAGKTTTIKCIVQIHDYDKGDILIDGKNIKEHSLDVKKIIHYIPDTPQIYGYLKGIEFLDFIANIFEVKEDVKNKKIEEYATLFGIKSELNSLISTYSHGMKQKLSIISALLHEPKLLILDEPFVGLDAVANHDLRNLFKELCEKGTSILFSSHNLDVVEKLCDNIAIIKDGKLVVNGSVFEVVGDKSLESLFISLSKNETI